MSLLSDLRFAVRMLSKRPGLTAMAVFALALGIGLTTTMFSIVYGAIIRGLPYHGSDRLMHLDRTNLAEHIQEMDLTIHDFTDWRAAQQSFEDLGAFYNGTVNVSGTEGVPERFDGAFVTANTFEILGVRPEMGRLFHRGEDHPSAAPVVIIGHDVWQTRFSGDPQVIGRLIRANGQTMTIVGVMPREFHFPLREDMWLPLRLDPLAIKRGEGQNLDVFGRLKRGVPDDAALAELSTIARRLETAYPETNKGIGATMRPFVHAFIGREAVSTLFAMLGAVFGVLLIACANVANLLLARAAVRTKEVAIRTALGASRLRVIGQLLAEAVMLAIAGGAGGAIIAKVGVDLFNRALAATDKPYWIDIRIDPTALVFVMGLTFIAAILSGLVPAIQASRPDVNDVLKDESRGASSLRLGRLSRGLVVAEIALSCGLLVGAGLMIKSVVRLRTVDWGFSTHDVFTARVGLFPTDYPDNAARGRFFDELLTRLEGKPGVRSATVVSTLPVDGTGRDRFAIDGQAYATDRDYPMARIAVAAPRLPETFGVGMLQGRDFARSDAADAMPVAIVNQSFARKFFPNASPVGRRIRIGRAGSKEPWRTIVGVAPDLAMNDPDSPIGSPEGFYLPLAQEPRQFMSIAIRAQPPALSADGPMALTAMVRDEVAAIDRNLPIYFVRSMDEHIVANTWFYGVFGTLFMVFGFAALFLAGVGLYGVMAFSVSRRTQEIGIRMALGARGRDVLRLVLRQGAIELVIGVTLGLALGAVIGRGIAVLLFDVKPSDPFVFGAIVLTLVLTGIAACIVPARRAIRVDPLVALRYE